MKNILITGGAGFIGGHLTDALINRKDSVTVVDNLNSQAHPLTETIYKNPNAEYFDIDIFDFEIKEKFDAIVHLASLVGVGQSMYDIYSYTENNTTKTAKLLQDIVNSKYKPSKLVVASSMSIYGEGAYICHKHERFTYPIYRRDEDLKNGKYEHFCPICKINNLESLPTRESKPIMPTSVYAITKRDQEELSLIIGNAYNIPSIALRFFNVYGVRQSLSNPYTGVVAIFSSNLINGNSPIIYEDGNQSRDFINVQDIVQGIIKSIDYDLKDSFACNLGTGIPTTLNSLLDILQNELKTNLKSELTHQYRIGDIRHCYADIELARRKLGFEPQIKLKDGIHELVQWIKNQNSIDNSKNAKEELNQYSLIK